MSRHRRICGLREARECAKPGHIPKPRLTGSRAGGIRFENRVAKALPHAKHGPWFEFVDANGPGHCSPDLILALPGRIVVLECKLTETPWARLQLRELYFPVLSLVYGLPVQGIVVCRALARESDTAQVVESLDAALAVCSGFIPTVQWLGRGRL